MLNLKQLEKIPILKKGGTIKTINIMIPDIIRFFNGGGIPIFQNSGIISNSNDIGESSYAGGELPSSIITPKQSKINRRQSLRKTWRHAKKLLKSNQMDSQDLLNVYNTLDTGQKQRALEFALKFSHDGNVGATMSAIKDELLKKPVKGFRILRYIVNGKGRPKLLGKYNGLWNNSNKKISNGILDAMIYGKTIDPRIGIHANKDDFGPEINYINKYYGDRNIQYIETNPGITVDQNGIVPKSYVGRHGSFKTSMPGVLIDTNGFILQKGTKDGITYVRGLDVYDFKANDYNRHTNSDAESLVNQIDKDTDPVAIKTPWVPEKDIDMIFGDPLGGENFVKY